MAKWLKTAYLWIRYGAKSMNHAKKNHPRQPHGQQKAHPHGGHHEWHVYARLYICLSFLNVHWCSMSGARMTIKLLSDLVQECTMKKTSQIYLIRSLDLSDPALFSHSALAIYFQNYVGFCLTAC